MRVFWLFLAGVAWSGAVLAQNAPIQSQPLPPLQQQWDREGSPPVREAPQSVPPSQEASPPQPATPPQSASPSQSATPSQSVTPSQAATPSQSATPPQGGAQSPGVAQSAPAAPLQPMTLPNTWLPASGAKIQALDKVNDQTATLTVKVGQSATFGSLTITVKACVVRPTDQPADAAAYLAITDSHPDSAPFDGWMLMEEPSVSMMQNPIYDVRVAGCT